MQFRTSTQNYQWLALLITLLSTALNSQALLETIKHKGKDYVSVRSLKTQYGFPQLKIAGKKITLYKPGLRVGNTEKFALKIEFIKGSKVCFMNKLKFGLSSAVSSSGTKNLISKLDVDKMIAPILKPQFIPAAKFFNTVIIDPGHGGKDAGAVNRYGTEAEYNFKVARILKAGLTGKGYNVIMTRNSDVFLSLKQRVALANRYKNAIFISIHFNASSRISARGIETFTLSPKGVAHYGRGIKKSDFNFKNGNHHDSANIALATAVHGQMNELTRKNNVPDRGVKRARFSVLSNIQHPAILIEGGFMSNPTEALLIESKVYQRKIATSIYRGILRYKSALQSRRH